MIYNINVADAVAGVAHQFIINNYATFSSSTPANSSLKIGNIG